MGVVWYVWLWLHLLFSRWRGRGPARFRRRAAQAEAPVRRCRAKPPWVVAEVIRLQALMPELSYRKLAETFNRLFIDQAMTVSHTYVAYTVRRHVYEIRLTRNEIKHRNPGASAPNRVWGMDLTFKVDESGDMHPILGIIDHGTRADLALSALPNKASVTILRGMLDAVEKYGTPKCIRTDNEAVFNSRLFRLGLRWLGIRHQTTDRHCPWMNGRIERFFGTLKERLNQLSVSNRVGLNDALAEFRFFYNHVRPHQHLNGRTPAELWCGRDIFKTGYRKAYFYTAWEGLLRGYYLPP